MLIKHHVYILIITTLIITFVYKISPLITLTQSSKILSAYETLATSVTYQLVFTMTGSIPANSIVQISFSQRFLLPVALTNCKASSTSGVLPTSRTCQTDTGSLSGIQLINVQGLFPITSTYTYIALQFTIDNPWAQVAQTVNVYIKQTPSDAPYASGAISIDYIASTMSSCLISSSALITGAPSIFTIQLTPIRKLLSGMFMLVYLPFWYSTLGSLNSSQLLCTGVQGTDSSNLGCSILTFGAQQTINISNIVNANKTLSTPMIITLQTLKNPWNTQPFGPIDYQLIGTDSYVSQRCNGAYLTVTQANLLKGAQLAVTNTSISGFTANTYLRIYVKNPVPKLNTRLRMTFPSYLTVVYSKTNVVSQNSTQILFNSITSSDVSPQTGQFILSLFNITYPPHSKLFSVTYTTQLYNNTQSYLIDTLTVQYQATSGVITSASVTANSYYINKFSTYVITFQTINSLTIGSFITIQFPNVLNVNIGNGCTTNSSLLMSCTATSTSNITLNVTAAIPSATQIKVTVNNVTNGPQSLTTNSFQIRSYYLQNDYQSLVDSITTGITVTLIANPISSPLITPTSLQTFKTTSYNFSMTLSDPIPTAGYIVLQFPPQVSPASAALLSASFTLTNCVLNKNSQILNITGCFPVSPMSNLNFQLVLSGIRNPRSLQQTSGSFKISTYDSVSLINYVTSGLSVTMTTATNVNSLTITPDNLTVHSSTTYSITLVHTVTIQQINDYYLLTLPNPMTFPALPSCSVNSGVSNISCSIQNSSTIKVTYLGSPSITTVVRIGSISNYDIGDTAVSFTLKFYTANGKLSQVSSGSTVTYNEASTLTVAVNNDQYIAVNDTSNITLTVTTPFALDSSFDFAQTNLLITIPTQFTIGPSCSSSIGSCAPISSTQYQVTQIGLQLINVPIILRTIPLPYFNPSSTTFKLQYLYGTKNVSVIDIGVFVSVYCTSPCKRCNGTRTACLSCLGPPNTLIYYDPQFLNCLIQCPSGKYPDATNQCQFCIQPCSTCSNQVDCQTCVNNTWLYQKQCLAVCPDTYYNDTSGFCLSCQDPCNTCTSISQCTSCLTKYLTGTSCVDPSSCPPGTFPNSTSLKCQLCTSPCSNCDISPTSCVTCITNYLYISSNKTCVQNCPNKMYKVGNQCFSCVSPCDSCTTSTICTSCTIDYFSNGSCVLPANCPNGTYPDSTTNRCQTCKTGCTQCQTLTNCTTCNAPIYLFYNYACITTCPSGTYKDSISCQSCSLPCSTCVNISTNCTGCQSPKYFYFNQCLDICPDTYYQNSALRVCSKCLAICNTCNDGSTCSKCISGLYLNAANNCVSQCPNGQFQDSITQSCVACNPPCSTCSLIASNCTDCISPKMLYLNGCTDTCPDQYFNVSGRCITCSYCMSCLDAQTCTQCRPSYYMYKGVCYSSCPTLAPIQDQITGKCGGCDPICFQCQGVAKNCTKCFNGQYLFNNDCVDSCPTGYIADIASSNCIQPLIGRVLYFPCTFTWIACIILLIYSKCRYEQTQAVTSLAAMTILCQYASWFVLSFILNIDATIQQSIIQIFFFVGIVIIGINLIIGVTYNIAIYFSFECDRGFQGWKDYQQSCVYSYRVITVFSGLTFRFFRFLYGRLFNRVFFSAYFSDSQKFLSITNKMSFASVVLFSLPMIGISAVCLYLKQVYDQTFFSSLDTMILGFASMVLIIIDSCKDKSYFQNMDGSLPFLKYKGLQGESFASGQLLSRDHFYLDQERPITDVSQDTKQRIFRNIKFLQDLNKFGHLNVIQDKKDDDKQQRRSLPQLDKLRKLQQYQPNDDDRVVFFQLDQQQQKRKRQEQQQLEQRKRKQLQLQEQQRIKQKMRKQEQQRLRKLKMQEDARQQVDLEFLDVAVIQKHQGKWKNDGKKSPLQMLAKCKKTDNKQIGQKQKKKLNQMAKKNGLDQDFMQQTFGIEKNHNSQLLNSIIDKHHGVKRQSVKQLFSTQNDQQVLQELFGKNSDMDKDKLKFLMNNPNAQQIIKKLANKQEGILSPQIAKQLLSKDSKYTDKFITQLLGGDEDLSQQKLKQLLKDSNKKGKQSPLKALQKIGGKNLENKEILHNMLGEDSVLNTDSFTRVANDLSGKAIQNLFKNRSQNTDLLAKKLLNNKKINLKGLAPILQDQQLIQDLANTFGNQNPNVQQNLINLFKNAQDIDPIKLKKLLNDPVLKKKLLQNPVDPQFLTQILKKDSNKDLDMIAKVIEDMPDQQIKQVFQFNPQKNVDFKSLATLFQNNGKTDPQLIKKMLDPKMVTDLYSKGNNDPKRLLKLVQKGANFDPQVILEIYGKKNGNVFDQQGQFDDGIQRINGNINLYDKNNKANLNEKNNNNNLNDRSNKTFLYDENNNDEFRSQKGGKLFNNMKNNMSRTDGGEMGFLSPLKMKGKARINGEDFVGDLMNRQTQYNERKQMQQQDEEGQQVYYQQQGNKKKKMKKKKKKKGFDDIRLDAQQIYLQRIEAPYEVQNRKKNIRKKKQKAGSTTQLFMDQDNDVIDLDF